MAFTMLMRSGIYPPELRSTNLDFDWLYRRAAPAVASGAIKFVGAGLRLGSHAVLAQLNKTHALVVSLHGPSGLLARALTSGPVTLIALLSLLLLLLFSFL